MGGLPYIYIYILHIYTYTPIDTNKSIHIYTYICIYIYGHALRGPPPPPPNGLGSPPFCGVGCGGVDWEALLPLWCCGWEGIPSFPVVWGLVGGNPSPFPLWCGVWWGRVRAGKSWWACGGREASLVRQTIFCGRRFCSETLGCPFKCFGRPWC